jgi:hypothetical protein
MYCSTVSLLPTHQPSTNKVVARNRRIGVGIIDYTGWIYERGVHKVIRHLREGYKRVRQVNSQANAEAGVPPAIRVTTVKPGGTVPKLPGKTSGFGFPTFEYTIRRIRQQQGTATHSFLVENGVPFEKDKYSKNTDVFSYPIRQGPAKPAEKATIWEQAINLVTLQREWADNAVSNTLYFRPKWQLSDVVTESVFEYLTSLVGNAASTIEQNKLKDYTVEEHLQLKLSYIDGTLSEAKVFFFDPNHEEDVIETVLSSIVPLCKSIALLPHTPNGVYEQMPEEGVSKEQWDSMKIPTIDWSQFYGSDGMDELYCSGPSCEIRSK